MQSQLPLFPSCRKPGQQGPLFFNGFSVGKVDLVIVSNARLNGIMVGFFVYLFGLGFRLFLQLFRGLIQTGSFSKFVFASYLQG